MRLLVGQITEKSLELRFSSWMCVQNQEKSAVARANFQHGGVLPPKIET